MSLLRRINALPQPGDKVEIYQGAQLLARGVVVLVDSYTVSIADQRGMVDLDTEVLRRSIRDGSMSIKYIS